MSINRVVLAGRLTKDPELKYSGSGVAMCRFTVAVNRQFKKDGQDEADFINCLCFNKTAENLANFQKKGSLIGVDGRIQTGKYTNADNQTVYTTDVVAESIQFLESKREGQAPQQQVQPQQQYQQTQQQGQFNRQEPQYQQMRTSDLAPTFGQPQQSNDPFAASKGPIEVNMNDLPF